MIGRAALTLTFFYSIFLPFFSLLEIDKLGEWIRIEFETCIEQFEKPGMYPSNFFSFFLFFFRLDCRMESVINLTGIRES